jgi:hypothetical protein
MVVWDRNRFTDASKFARSVRCRAYAGNFPSLWQFCDRSVRMENRLAGRFTMHGIIYLVGLIVVVLAILSFFGLR